MLYLCVSFGILVVCVRRFDVYVCIGVVYVCLAVLIRCALRLNLMLDVNAMASMQVGRLLRFKSVVSDNLT